MMKVAIVLRSTEHQPVSTTIVSYMACVSGLVSGEHVLDAVVAVAFVQPLGVIVIAVFSVVVFAVFDVVVIGIIIPIVIVKRDVSLFTAC